MFSEIFMLQLFSVLVLLFFIQTYNLLTLWLLAGLYLLTFGVWLLLDDGDIFVGFLWVIDLGVGLIFFMFILHYSTFLHQKAKVDKSSRELSFLMLAFIFVFSFMFFFHNPTATQFQKGFSKTWFFLVSWYDYYDFFYSYIVTDLNLIREMYFYNNSFEFFLINFLLFYGILGSMLLTFFIKKIFSLLMYDQVLYWDIMNKSNSIFFIKNQDYLKQSATSTGTSVWLKKKNTSL